MQDNFKYDWSGKSILIVEDTITSNLYFKVALKNSGALLLWAENGLEAITILDDNKVDLVLMDLDMPVMNGYEATARIKEVLPDLPVIIQTAYVLSGEEHLAYEAGCDAFLSKPLRLDSLIDKIQEFLFLGES